MRTLFCFLLSVILALCYNHATAQKDGGLRPGADTAAINHFFPPGYEHITDPDSVIIVFLARYKLCVAANYIDGGFTELIQISIKCEEKDDFENERRYCEQALPWAARSSIKDATAWCYNGIGDAWFNQGNYVEASAFYYKALEELKKMAGLPTHITANCYNNLGLVNIRLGQPQKALAYYKMAEDISRKYQMGFQLGNALTNRGEYYISTRQPDSAIKCFNEVMELGKRIGKADLRAQANAGLGKALVVSGDYQEAIPLLQTAIREGKSYPYIVVDASYALGDALYHTGNYKDAEAILLSALRETKAHNYRDNYLNCYSKLINTYKASGDYKKALTYTDSMNSVKDSLASYANVATVNQMEIKYQTAEKDKQLVENKLLITQQKDKIFRKNIWIASISGGVFLFSVVAVGTYRSKQRRQAQQIKSLQQDNTINILKGVVQGEEKERSRIARELHDGIGGMLSAVMMRLTAAQTEDKVTTAIPAYKDAMQLLNQMGDEIRKTAHNLMPEVLLKSPLQDAIRTYCDQLRQRNELDIEYQWQGNLDSVTTENKLNIYRIVQELLKNVVQHADATHVLVQLQANEQLLTITVEDNGRGFETGLIKTGMGLHNLQTRVQSMYGHMTIESAPGKGTSAYIEFDTQKMIHELS